MVWNIQELIVLELKLIEPVWKKRGRIYEKKSLQAFESKCGIQPVTLSPEDRKGFEAAARRTQAKLADENYPRELLNDVLNALEKHRQK